MSESSYLEIFLQELCHLGGRLVVLVELQEAGVRGSDLNLTCGSHGSRLYSDYVRVS